MKTEVLKVTGEEADRAHISKAGDILKKGGLVAIPTETVYGLAANAYSTEAIDAIFAAKGRPRDNPVIVHVAAFSEISPLVAACPEAARDVCRRFWPGPLTVIFKKSPLVPDAVSAGLETVAVRCPAHPIAAEVIRAAGVPLAAPSANTSGRPSATTAAHVLEDMDGKIPLILDGGPTPVGVESTVLDLSGEAPLVLRPGEITLEMLAELLPGVRYDTAVFGKLPEHTPARSPGTKYTHYAPRGELLLVRGGAADAMRTILRLAEGQAGAAVLCYDGEGDAYGGLPAVAFGPAERPDIQARKLFGALRELDGLDAKKIYARLSRQTEGAAALYNRLLRAAGFQVIEAEG
ncbi:threonylcarbamoyl-AMP synthase [Oscillospiraceae bacterium OttesenSCG-928-F05]|nr:threonylcarbamoyl-AMP synthase [Oscillospiraceae bacterium OttesenSCG-928-F05]